MKRFGHLRQLFGAYLHQDFAAEFGDVEKAARAYARDEPHDVKPALSELDELSRAHAGRELEQKLTELGCAVDAKGDAAGLIERIRRGLHSDN